MTETEIAIETPAQAPTQAQIDSGEAAHPSIDVYQLTNGTHVVARTLDVDLDTGTFIMEKPLELHVMPTPQGVRSQFSPWLSVYGLFPALDHHVIDNADLFLVRPAPQKLADAYLEATGERTIAMPEEKKLIVPGV